MRYDAVLHAYDCLDTVVVTAIVRESEELGPIRITQDVQFSTTLRGEGISDPRQWLQDALIGLVETI